MSTTAADGSALVGTVLAGRYRVLRKLGEGAMGAVYLGEHLRIGRRDAIKVLRDSLAGDAEARARFDRGTRNVSSIRHPNVCTVYDFGDLEDGRSFLAMEFVPGETLQELLAREGRLPPARAVSIAAQVAGALQAAHEAGIVHRDLKPGNVMVSPGRGGADEVKVVDFDIAKGSAEGQAGDVTRLGFVIGTPEYMSPEQLLGMPLDGRSDVYSLALVLFRMLAGALPFRAQDTQELMVQRLTGTPLRLDEVLPALRVSPALQAALDRALQRRAEDRFAGAGDFADAILAAVAEPAASAPVSAAPDVADSAPRGWTGRGGDTGARVPATVVTVDRGPASAEGGGWRIALPAIRPARAAIGAAAVIVLLGGAWGISRALGPPEGPSTALQTPPAGGADAAFAPGGAPVPPVVVPAPADSAAAAGAADPPPAPAGQRAPEALAEPPEPTRREPEPRTEASEARPPASGPRGTPPSADPPPADPPPARRGGVTASNAPEVLDGLKRRLRDPGLSAGELREIRGAAQAAWALGDALSARDRADAAYVLGTVAQVEGDWAGCVRWLDRAAQMNPATARRVQPLLALCRERQA